jgi:CRISPR/Cas system CMR-associated protein Cmr1 (group 7 of RAMP superfamily)
LRSSILNISNKPIINISNKPIRNISNKPIINISNKPIINISNKPIINISNKPCQCRSTVYRYKESPLVTDDRSAWNVYVSIQVVAAVNSFIFSEKLFCVPTLQKS